MEADMDRRLELEILVDRLGLYELLSELAEVAYEKASHLQTSWQDHEAARRWRIAAGRIERAARDIRGTV
jgi:hypothetical protein